MENDLMISWGGGGGGGRTFFYIHAQNLQFSLKETIEREEMDR